MFWPKFWFIWDTLQTHDLPVRTEEVMCYMTCFICVVLLVNVMHSCTTQLLPWKHQSWFTWHIFLCLIIYITEADAFIQSDLQVRDTLKLPVQSYKEGVERDVNRREGEERWEERRGEREAELELFVGAGAFRCPGSWKLFQGREGHCCSVRAWEVISPSGNKVYSLDYQWLCQMTLVWNAVHEGSVGSTKIVQVRGSRSSYLSVGQQKWLELNASSYREPVGRCRPVKDQTRHTR